MEGKRGHVPSLRQMGHGDFPIFSPFIFCYPAKSVESAMDKGKHKHTSSCDHDQLNPGIGRVCIGEWINESSISKFVFPSANIFFCTISALLIFYCRNLTPNFMYIFLVSF